MTSKALQRADSNWKPVAGWKPSPAVLSETLDGGQSFRWQSDGETWTGIWGGTAAELQLRSGTLAWRSDGAANADALALNRYLALDHDWDALTDSLPWRSDAHLAQCIAVYPGLRLLRQPFGETLLGFLCSATKQIVQIKQMIALLAERHGALLPNGRSSALGPRSMNPESRDKSAPPSGSNLRRLPTWSELAAIPENELRACLLGFRARYIAQTAQFLAARPGWLDETENLPYVEAKGRLMELPGVGEKVADCVLLFGAGKLEAFPVDTWVLKSLARRYGLDGWKPAQVAHFGRTHFGPLAGLAQQYLFAWERRHGGR